jgi:hypothetical protein
MFFLLRGKLRPGKKETGRVLPLVDCCVCWGELFGHGNELRGWRSPRVAERERGVRKPLAVNYLSVVEMAAVLFFPGRWAVDENEVR